MSEVAAYQIESLESREDPLPHHLAGLSYTRTGYGRKIPTTRKVRLPGEKIWRRVYCCIFSNIGTCYVEKKGNWVVIF
jgi:hypothetical protein